jgi:hypothetical protein
MDLATATAVEGLAIQGLTAGIKLYKELRTQNPSLPPVEEILAEADKIADGVVKKADKEIADAQAQENANKNG